jgi:ATP-dependent protease ClpP protease subunit
MFLDSLGEIGDEDDGMDEAACEHDGPLEIALVGDLTDNEGELTEKLLSVPLGGECTLYIDSPGGSPYCATSLASIMVLRGIKATGIVTGECSSAALWPFAACHRRIVTPYSVMLFHPMKWQSEEHVDLSEAAEWARHFGALEKDMDRFLIELFDTAQDALNAWISPGRYVSGAELADAGLAEMVELHAMKSFMTNGAAAGRRGKSRGQAPGEKAKRRGKAPVG